MDKAILYVDDEPINVMLFEVNYGDKFPLLTANSAHDALDVLRRHPEISLVISDMKMLEMSGVDLAYQIKREAPLITVCILTGYEILPEIYAAIKDKVVERYYSKPFNIDSLAQDMLEYLAR